MFLRPDARDRRVDPARIRPHEYALPPIRRVRRPRSTAAAFVVGFLVIIAIGALLLSLPVSTADGTWTPPITAFFTATSAVTVTGLTVVDTAAYWSPFGQVVLLALVQVGGFGFMTGSTLFLFLLVGRRTGLGDRMLAQAGTGTADLGTVAVVVRRVALFSLVTELAGTILLTIGFVVGYAYDPLDALWLGLFHAVSAFNNAGLDLFGEFRSLAPFSGDPFVLSVFGVLILLGGLGFAIVGDLAGRHRWRHLSLETRVVVLTTSALLLIGSTLFLVLEWSNPATLGALPESARPFHALFETTSLRTAGFSTMPTGALHEATLVIVMGLMFIGGASGSTAGGIKVNTFSVLLAAIVSTVRGRPWAELLGRRLPEDTVYRALSVALLSIAFVFTTCLGLQILGNASFARTLFESVSAFATVGASTGITTTLPPPAQALLIPAMFAGRLGPLTLVIALAARSRPVSYRPAVETLRIG